MVYALLFTLLPFGISLLFCFSVFQQWLHNRTGNTFLYLEATELSRALQHATETMDSVPTVRFFGMTERFTNHFYRLVDACVVAHYSFRMCYRANRLLAGVCALVVVFSALVISVIVPISRNTRWQPSSVGLVLSSALTVSSATLCHKPKFEGMLLLRGATISYFGNAGRRQRQLPVNHSKSRSLVTRYTPLLPKLN